jgi:signal transduction histidine kinase
LDQPTILMVSDDAVFANVLKGRWQSEAQVPAFTLMGSDLCRDLDADAFTLAVVGPLRSDALSNVLSSLNVTEKPVLLVCQYSVQAEGLRKARSSAIVLVEQEGWPDMVVALASEITRRREAILLVEQLEVANAILERHAALGGYILEMRHTLNNALTSILGNAELLLLDAETVRPGARAQIETIRNMAVRIHETLARFSSIDKELSTLERPLATTAGKVRTAAAGTIQ